MHVGAKKRPDAGARPRYRVVGVGVLCAAIVLACSLCAIGCSDAMGDARELENAGDWEGALAIYQQVFAEDPNDTGALSGAAVSLMALQRYDEALVLQERVVAIDATDVLIRVEVGFNYLNHQGRAADAVRVLREAADLEPSAKNLTFLAQAQSVSGDDEGAESTLRRAIEVDTRYSYAYTQLVSLLEDQGRTEDADEVRQEAGTLGISMGDPR